MALVLDPVARFGEPLDPTPLFIRRVSVQPTRSHHGRVRPAPVRRVREPRGVYARRRLAVGFATLALLAAAFAAFLSLTNTGASADGAGMRVPTRYVVAQPGDTLWAIAERIAPNGDTIRLVEQLAFLNGPSIAVGQVVFLP